jgi:hypothetical protein
MRPLVLSDNYFIYQGTKLNPLDVWDAISHPNHLLTPLAQLARQILSICPNSASVERLWSLFISKISKKLSVLSMLIL